MTVRAAGPDDVDTVVGLRLALLAEYEGHPLYGRVRPDAAIRARVQEAARLGSPRELVLLAEVGGACVGLLRCAETTGSPLLDPSRHGYVSSVYVAPAHRRRGVLRALLEAAEAWCTARGLTEIRLHHVPEHDGAAASWEALGFEVREVMRARAIPARRAARRRRG